MPQKPFLHHAAIYVKNLDRAIEFFDTVIGMKVEKESAPNAPAREVWLEGGVQLTSNPGFAGPEGRCNHLGIKVPDVDAVLARAKPYNIVPVPGKPPFWFSLPEGLTLEFLKME